MKLTRRQMFSGLLAPFAAPKLLEAAKRALPVSGIAIHRAAINPPNRYNSDTFYRMGVDFTRPVFYPGRPATVLRMLDTAARQLHSKVMDAAAGRKVIWCAPMELHGFVDSEEVGPIGPVPRCRHIAAYDIAEDRWIHRVDVEVAFVWPGGTHVRYCGPWKPEYKIGDTISVRKPIRWSASSTYRPEPVKGGLYTDGEAFIPEPL